MEAGETRLVCTQRVCHPHHVVIVIAARHGPTPSRATSPYLSFPVSLGRFCGCSFCLLPPTRSAVARPHAIRAK